MAGSGIIHDLADVSISTMKNVSGERRGRARVNLGHVPSEDVQGVETLVLEQSSQYALQPYLIPSYPPTGVPFNL